MALYLDSAILEEATTAAQSGWVYGITTNPTLLAKSGYPPDVTLHKLGALGAEEVYYQVRAKALESMYEELEKAKEILGDKLVVKIPPTDAGFRFATEITSDQKTCITAIFSPAQAIVARETGANYIAVYVNRATKYMGDGIQLTHSIAEVLHGSSTEILAASLKSTDEVIQAFNAGAQHLTLPFDLLSSLIEDPHSKQAIEQFNQSQAHL